MILYDQEASIDWFYDRLLSSEEMRGMPEYRKLFEQPCVLYDNGAGKVYRFEPLVDLAARCAVPAVLDPGVTFAMCEEAMSGAYKAPGVEAAEAKAEEAKEIASQAGMDPQLQALATLQVSTMSFDAVPCDTVVQFIDYWPEWQEGHEYRHNDPITYQGRKFRASKNLTSQAIYPPGTAESEYYEVVLAEDGVIVWYEVGGEYNMVYKGERRHYPDASGPVYQALEDTTYSPDAYPQHWQLVE